MPILLSFRLYLEEVDIFWRNEAARTDKCIKLICEQESLLAVNFYIDPVAKTDGEEHCFVFAWQGKRAAGIFVTGEVLQVD